MPKKRRNTFRRNGIQFASSVGWPSCVVDYVAQTPSSWGVQVVTLSSGIVVCHYTLSPLSTQVPGAVYDYPMQHRLLAHLPEPDYWGYINSPEWRRRAASCKKAAGYRCQMPGGWLHGLALQAHHLSYANFGNEMPDDLLCVCDDCHRKRSGK
jgi:hypothetical protein